MRTKVFSSREEANKYYNYLVVSVDATGREDVRQFSTRRQAESYNEQINLSGEILTRKQYERRNK